MKPEKCEFHSSSFTFLGYILAVGQMKTSHTSIQGVTDWPTPSTCKHLKQFLGFVNFYQRFILDYSKIVTPLTQLTQFIWSAKADVAFTKLKQPFTAAPILILPDTKKPFVVEVNVPGWVRCCNNILVPRANSPLRFFRAGSCQGEKNYGVGD